MTKRRRTFSAALDLLAALQQVALARVLVQRALHPAVEASALLGTDSNALNDSYFSVWIFGWQARQLIADPLNLFQGNIFFPFPQTLAFSEIILPGALTYLPLDYATGNPVLAYNLVVIASFALNGKAAISSKHSSLFWSQPTCPIWLPFIEITGLRELRDGRVMVLDRRDRAIYLIDLSRNTSTKVGRDGDGPGEYRLPLRLLALPGDTTAAYDMGNSGRLVTFTPEGRPGSPITLAYPGSQPEHTDVQGRLYSLLVESPFAPSSRDPSPVTPIARWDRATGRRDSVAAVNLRIVTPLPRPSRPGPINIPFFTTEEWAVAHDGRVAVVSPDPYRVTLFGPAVSTTVGPPLPWQPVPVSNRHKQEWREERQRLRPAIIGTRDGTTYTFVRGSFREPEEWPRFLPPFLPDGLRAALEYAASALKNEVVWDIKIPA